MPTNHTIARPRHTRSTIRLGLAATTALLTLPLLGTAAAYADGETAETPTSVTDTVTSGQATGPAPDEVTTTTGTAAGQPAPAGPESDATPPGDAQQTDAQGGEPAAEPAPTTREPRVISPAPQQIGSNEDADVRLPAAAEALRPNLERAAVKPKKQDPTGEVQVEAADTKKVVVCKFTQTPSSNELLAHINVVSANTLKGWDGVTFPFSFSDQQGMSKAIRFAEAGEQSSDFDDLSPQEVAALCAGAPATGDLTVLKRDFETDAPLAGAQFTVYRDVEPVGTLTADDEAIATVASDTDGEALFADLAHGVYLVEETAPPAGYAAAADPVRTLEVDAETHTVTFHNRANGQLVIVSKQQLELVDGTWQASDGVVDFGDQLKYVIEVSATGDKLFHDVTVTDYIPGSNPLDVTSTDTATLVPGSAVCTGDLTCAVDVDDSGLVTWSAGTVGDQAGTVELVVTFPEAEVPDPLTETTTFTTTLWNQAYLSWREVEDRAPLLLNRGFAAAPTDPECPVGFTCSDPITVASNTVTATASQTIVVDGQEPQPEPEPEPNPTDDDEVIDAGPVVPTSPTPDAGEEITPGGVLPATGSSGNLGGLVLGGLLLVAVGAALTWRGARRPELGG